HEVIYNPCGRPLKGAELVPLISDVDGYIAGLDEVDTSVIESANRLNVIARYGVGTDRVAIDEATTQGIVVTNTPGTNSVAVAELTIAFLLVLARDLITANEAVRKGEWPSLNGIGIRGKTVGLIGLGAVGREVALRLKNFGCRVLAVDPFVGPEIAEKYGARIVSLDALLPQADVVSLHAPATESTVGMVNREFLQRMKSGSFLRGAALDCFSQEPPDANNPLLGLPQVIAAPHIAAHTDEAINQMGWTALENCLAALRGDRPVHVVNPEVFER
ncbi:MAG: phosphoglycerate dehydrogenase, partial [Deltaproteobacteria bacterium]